MLVGSESTAERDAQAISHRLRLEKRNFSEGDEIVNTKACVFGLVAACGLASTASATVVATFGYSDLRGSYNSGAGQFTAVAVDNGSFQSAGDVTRLLAPGGTAQFEPGFVSNPQSNFTLNISVFNIVGNTADGSGSFTATDLNGDRLDGNIRGNWISPGSGIVFFNGLLTNVVFTSVSGDNNFNSADGGFTLTGLTGNVYSGALVQLFTRVGGGFFNSSFDNVSTLVAGDLVPTPGAAALLGIGGLFALRRNRRR